MEERINFISDNLTLEGILCKNTSVKGVVIAHPHPQYGGNMFDYVAESISNSFWEKGYTTLRFNFRGVGKSQGRFDNGIGEQKDLCGAISYLSGVGIKNIDLAGYSFGAWIITKINHDALGINNCVLVSPPAAFMDFKTTFPISTLKLIVTGSDDEYAPYGAIKKMLEYWKSSARLEVIQGCDHFYGGYHVKLEEIIKEALGDG